MSKEKTDRPVLLRGFTLVEMLVVMAILAVLIGIAVAGIGFALRRSRNIARQAAAANLDRALEAFYSDEQIYPDESVSIANMVDDDDPATQVLYPYLEGSWDAPPISSFSYRSDQLRYAVCVSQEEAAGEFSFRCYGPGVDYNTTQWPTDDPWACDAAHCGIFHCVTEEGIWAAAAGCCTPMHNTKCDAYQEDEQSPVPVPEPTPTPV